MTTRLAKNTQSQGVNDDDVQISYQDQSKINSFAINNNKLHDLQDDLADKKKELENVSEAIDELIVLDETEIVPFQYGEVYTYLSVKDASVELEKKKEQVEEQINALQNKIKSVQDILADLKKQLYAKFGNKINLEENETD